MSFDVRVVGMDKVIADLDRATTQALPETEKLLGRGALNIKKDWQAAWKSHPRIKHLPWAISYELFHLPGSVRAEIGTDRGRRQGGLGSYIALGTVNSAPIPGPFPALEAEAPRMEMALSALSQKLLAG